MKFSAPSPKALIISAIALVSVAVIGIVSLSLATQSVGQTKASPEAKMKEYRVGIVYFSHSGNTRRIAEQIKSVVGGDLIEVKTVKAYPEDYDSCVAVGRVEHKEGARPELSTKLSGMESYDVFFVGYPNWFGTMPMAMFTFFDAVRTKGKVLVPFVTHEGSKFGSSLKDLKALNPEAEIREGIAIRGKKTADESTRSELAAWLNKSGIKAKDSADAKAEK